MFTRTLDIGKYGCGTVISCIKRFYYLFTEANEKTLIFCNIMFWPYFAYSCKHVDKQLSSHAEIEIGETKPVAFGELLGSLLAHLGEFYKILCDLALCLH